MTDDEASEPRVRFLLGGARSGKSRLAVRLARGDGDVLFLATARPEDDEMAARVERHRQERPDDWRTVEAPLRLPETIREAVEPRDTVVLDCLTLWVSNLMAEGEPEERVLARSDDLVAAIAARGRRWIVVSNEVGSGLHPDTRLGRRYRDLLGLVNQRVAAAADRAHLVVAGRLLDLEPPAPGSDG